ncbi:PREDICTED: F-box protein At2g26160-like [Prunus mume]|uniref:F-box protein At2g26160-like n=1 Tax=Prunus mume TaxID=102107 RepID=A0ABM0PUM8_PRUMU|nr:PREDICTED: F-box protein At2g26160-like [Prunus mume]
MGPDWSDLPQELVISIANRIAFMEDFAAFGAVCKPWRLVATKENFTGRLSHPFLMLPGKDGAAIREFYSFTKDGVQKVNLPEAEGKLLCYCSGWLITLEGLKFTLLHPFNRAQIKLPDFRDSDGRLSPTNMSHFHTVKKFVLSSNPSWTSDFAIMVLYDHKHLAFCKPREHKYWTSMVLDEHPLDITCYKGRFYAMCYNEVLVFDIENPKQAKTRVVVQASLRRRVHGSFGTKTYMVESAGDLLVVFSYGDIYRQAPSFRVSKVLRDGKRPSKLEVKDLGNRTLFLGDNNSSFSVMASDYGCKPNCIYFFSCIYRQYIYPEWGDWLVRSKENINMGIFHMEDGRFEQHFGSPSFALKEAKFPTFGTPCFWIQPSSKRRNPLATLKNKAVNP